MIPDLDPITDQDGTAVALTLGSIPVRGGEGPQVHPRSASPSGQVVAGRHGYVKLRKRPARRSNLAKKSAAASTRHRSHIIYLAARSTHRTDIFVSDRDELAEVRWAALAEAEQLMQS